MTFYFQFEKKWDSPKLLKTSIHFFQCSSRNHTTCCTGSFFCVCFPGTGRRPVFTGKKVCVFFCSVPAPSTQQPNLHFTFINVACHRGSGFVNFPHSVCGYHTSCLYLLDIWTELVMGQKVARHTTWWLWDLPTWLAKVLMYDKKGFDDTACNHFCSFLWCVFQVGCRKSAFILRFELQVWIRNKVMRRWRRICEQLEWHFFVQKVYKFVGLALAWIYISVTVIKLRFSSKTRWDNFNLAKINTTGLWF